VVAATVWSSLSSSPPDPEVAPARVLTCHLHDQLTAVGGQKSDQALQIHFCPPPQPLLALALRPWTRSRAGLRYVSTGGPGGPQSEHQT
jgi:hypothetical protein